MVFQSYAIWPHMTVEENVAFPLKARRFPQSEIKTACCARSSSSAWRDTKIARARS